MIYSDFHLSSPLRNSEHTLMWQIFDLLPPGAELTYRNEVGGKRAYWTAPSRLIGHIIWHLGMKDTEESYGLAADIMYVYGAPEEAWFFTTRWQTLNLCMGDAQIEFEDPETFAKYILLAWGEKDE